MTSASKADKRKGGCVDLIVKREGVQNPENIAHIICTWSLWPILQMKSAPRDSNGKSKYLSQGPILKRSLTITNHIQVILQEVQNYYHFYRGAQNGLQNIVKQDPGRERQNS